MKDRGSMCQCSKNAALIPKSLINLFGFFFFCFCFVLFVCLFVFIRLFGLFVFCFVFFFLFVVFFLFLFCLFVCLFFFFLGGGCPMIWESCYITIHSQAYTLLYYLTLGVTTPPPPPFTRIKGWRYIIKYDGCYNQSTKHRSMESNVEGNLKSIL